MTKSYDVAVLGLGTMGSLACMELARRKVSVVGLDRFAPPHALGSHTGDTRVFRTAYAEHPDYVPLAQIAGELWDRYGIERGSRLLTRCGQLNVGAPEDELMAGIRRSAAQYAIPVEEVDEEEIRKRYPAVAPAPGHIGLLDRTAGWIDVNAAIEFALTEARRAGADILLNRPVLRWENSGGTIALHTGEGEIHANKLVISAGAWSGGMLPHLPLTIERRVLLWVRPLAPELFAEERFPVFTFAERFFYGFPELAGKGVKIALHWLPGERLEHPTDSPPPSRKDLEIALEFAARYLPALAGPLPEAMARVLDSKSCLYTMTPDEHFVVDRHPAYENVFFAAGFSGHGFKFAPAIATALADLAISARTELPIGFLRQARLITGSIFNWIRSGIQ